MAARSSSVVAVHIVVDVRGERNLELELDGNFEGVGRVALSRKQLVTI